MRTTHTPPTCIYIGNLQCTISTICKSAHLHSFAHAYQHRPGWRVVHLGTHRHGADDIATGERLNLIVWTRNLEFRRSAAYNAHQQGR